MKGGVTYIDTLDENDELIQDSEAAFNYFVKHSVRNKDLNLSSSFGIIIICNFPKDKVSSSGKLLLPPYVVFRNHNFAERVYSIAIKLSLIHTNDKFTIIHNTIKKSSVRLEDFEKEVKIQSGLVEVTLRDLEPITPTVLYAKPYINKEEIDLLFLNISKGVDLTSIRESITGTQYIGVLVMEFADEEREFRCLNTALEPGAREINEQYFAVALFEIIRLANYGFIHGDHHWGNLLVSENYKGYFLKNPESSEVLPWFSDMRVYIIDWGLSYKLTNVQRREFAELYGYFIRDIKNDGLLKGNLLEMMIFIHDKGFFFNGRDHKFQKIHFNWIVAKNIITDSLALKMRELFFARKRGVDKTKDFLQPYMERALSIRHEEWDLKLVDLPNLRRLLNWKILEEEKQRETREQQEKKEQQEQQQETREQQEKKEMEEEEQQKKQKQREPTEYINSYKPTDTANLLIPLLDVITNVNNPSSINRARGGGFTIDKDVKLLIHQAFVTLNNGYYKKTSIFKKLKDKLHSLVTIKSDKHFAKTLTHDKVDDQKWLIAQGGNREKTRNRGETRNRETKNRETRNRETRNRKTETLKTRKIYKTQKSI